MTRNNRRRDGLKERVELEKKGNIYNMVKMKLALIGVCGMDVVGVFSLFLRFCTANLVCKFALYYVFLIPRL